MTINRRQFAIAGATVVLVASTTGAAVARTQSPEAIAVSMAVEAFRVAMLGADKAALAALCEDALTYGHSSGRVETKAEFIAAAAGGKTTWKSITLTNTEQYAEGGIGYARHTLTGEALSEGKTTDVKVGVLMVWVNRGDRWRLLARQAFRV